MQPERRPPQQPQRRSDSAKLSFEIYGAVWLRFVGSALGNLAKASDFQAEYDGTRQISEASFGDPAVCVERDERIELLGS
jgi:hypothetical protein